MFFLAPLGIFIVLLTSAKRSDILCLDISLAAYGECVLTVNIIIGFGDDRILILGFDIGGKGFFVEGVFLKMELGECQAIVFVIFLGII